MANRLWTCDGNELFKAFKGALTEQFVLQQLMTMQGLETYYWTNDRGGAEIDFLIDTVRQVIPGLTNRQRKPDEK